MTNRRDTETPGWFWQQWDRAGCVWEEAKRRHYRPQLEKLLDLKVGGVVVGVAREGERERDYPSVEQIDVLLLPRHCEWLTSQAFDRKPEVKHDRDADGDETGFDVAERLLERVGTESDEWSEWRGVIKDVWAKGSAVVMYGYDDDASTLEQMLAKGQGAGAAVGEALAGTHEPQPGQDHATLKTALAGEAMQVETALGPQGEQAQANLAVAAVQHAKMQDKEDRAPRDWTRTPRRMWVKRCPVGDAFRWSANATDLRDARILFRRIVMDVDIARSCPSFKASARAKIKPGRYAKDEGYQGAPADGTGAVVEADECVIVEVWDRKWDERHYIAEGVDEFLEEDARNPHVDEKGNFRVPGGVPFAYYCPIKTQKDDPCKPFGVPLGSYGWELQRLMIKLASHNLDAVKKVSVRMVELLGELIEDEEDALASGITGTIVHRPPELNTEQLKNVPLVRPIDFGRVDPAVFQQIVWAEQMLSKVMAWPLSQMTGAPQASTATGEEVAVAAGSSQLGDVISELQFAMEVGQQIKRAIVFDHYSPEDVADLIGQKSAQEFQAWRTAYPSVRGDRLTVKITPRSDDAVRRQQTEKVLAYLDAKVDPATMLPKYRTDAIVDEWVRLHGLGKPVPYEPSAEEMAAIQARAAQPEPGAEKPKGGGRGFTPRQGPGGGGGGPGARNSAARPTRAAQFSAVQRA